MEVEKDCFGHSCTERHADVCPMFKAASIPLGVLDSTAEVILIKHWDPSNAQHLAAGELTMEHLLEVTGR